MFSLLLSDKSAYQMLFLSIVHQWPKMCAIIENTLHFNTVHYYETTAVKKLL